MTPVSLVNRLAAPPAPKTPQTTIDRWVDTLNDNDRTAVLKAAADNAWRHIDLLPILIEEGMPDVSSSTLGAWRRKNGWGK